MKNKDNFFKQYHFEFKHLLVLLIALIIFQILVSYIQRTTLQHLLINTQDKYQKDSAEKLASLTSTSLELLLENLSRQHSEEESQKIIQAFNVILSQQKLQLNIREICILVSKGDSLIAIDNGKMLYDYFFLNKMDSLVAEQDHKKTKNVYRELKSTLISTERTMSIRDNENTFHVFVPFVPKGEYAGAVYIRNIADFTFITEEIITSFNEISIIFASLIFLGLLAMFFISSYTVKERNETQQLLFAEREKYLTEQIEHKKETMFTKRIYHTHHKAEKVMGFIKEDLNKISNKNIDEVKYRVTKYANFISRVIYDMKWYDPPLHSIRNPLFKTNINEVIKFLVNNIFLKVTSGEKLYKFNLELDPDFPVVHVNEFVIWEILEPLIQNSVDHADTDNLIITIKTEYEEQNKEWHIVIADNGIGFDQELLSKNENGIKKIFAESISSKKNGHNSGYGCYIAYEMAIQRCGWKLDAQNLENKKGCQFIITISSNKQG